MTGYQLVEGQKYANLGTAVCEFTRQEISWSFKVFPHAFCHFSGTNCFILRRLRKGRIKFYGAVLGIEMLQSLFNLTRKPRFALSRRLCVGYLVHGHITTKLQSQNHNPFSPYRRATRLRVVSCFPWDLHVCGKRANNLNWTKTCDRTSVLCYAKYTAKLARQGLSDLKSEFYVCQSHIKILYYWYDRYLRY